MEKGVVVLREAYEAPAAEELYLLVEAGFGASLGDLDEDEEKIEWENY